MKKLKTLRLMALICALMMLTATALADTALVVTENKGMLNLRKSPTTNSNRIARIPNLTTLEILDVDGDWAKATYDGKTGFVMTKFLRIASELAGKTVYDNEYGLVILRDTTGAAVMPADNLAGVPVESVSGDWATVRLNEETTLLAFAPLFTYQVTAAPSKITWIAEPGVAAQDCSLQLVDGGAVTLPAGSEVTVTELSGDNCLVISDEGCGYVPTAAISLFGPADTGAETGSVSPEKAQQRALEALKKNYKGVANESLTSVAAVYQNVYGAEMPYYHCGFFNADGQYIYGALVSAANAKVIYTARYTAFAAAPASESGYVDVTVEEPAVETEAEPIGETAEEPAAEGESPEVIMLTMEGGEQEQPAADSAAEELTMESVEDEPAAQESALEQTEAPAGEAAEAAGNAELAYTGDIELGDVEDIEIAAWTDHQCVYVISKDGEMVASSGPVSHFSTAFRPKEAGQYKLEVSIIDEQGGTASLETDFTVQEADTEGLLYDIYSMQDGWWTGVSFYTSSMAKDGSALFTLTHALSRIGVSSIEILPENLAVNNDVIQCLTEDGVDNAKLIKTAAELFGFKTQDDPLTDAAKISELLKDGAVFSFTNEKGSVVLAAGISDDGTLVQIIDPDPSRSFDEIPADTVFMQEEDGSFTAMSALEDDPYTRWYFETASYGGSEYWMKLDAVAPQGLLLIQAKD